MGKLVKKQSLLRVNMQALSKRIHYGKFVAEAKFRASPSDYEAAINSQVRIEFECIGYYFFGFTRV